MISVELMKKKETKATVVYESAHTKDGYAEFTIYVPKKHLSEPYPAEMQLQLVPK